MVSDVADLDNSPLDLDSMQQFVYAYFEIWRQDKVDGFVKSHHIDGKVKSSYARRANLEE
jgi:hypothetical protein